MGWVLWRPTAWLELCVVGAGERVFGFWVFVEFLPRNAEGCN